MAMSCGEPVPPNNPPGGDPCEPAATDDFAIGVVVNDSPRWFRQFDEGCNTVEMETGLQGGWHIEPAIQAPPDVVQDSLGGLIKWTVEDVDGNNLGTAEFEMFKNFWTELEGGLAYWGDFVIFRSNPEALVGSPLNLTLEVTFDEENSPDDFTIERTVDFVDENENTDFR